MSNPYRLRSSDLFLRLDDGINEQPRRIVFLSVEGSITEVDYFRNIDKFRAELGINALVRIEVIRRSYDDTRSDPSSVLSLLEELVDLHENGADVSKLVSILPPCYDAECVRTYLTRPESIDAAVVSAFRKKMHSIGLDIAYMKFVSSCDEREDLFCVVLDRDSDSHSIKQLEDTAAKCFEKGYKFFITSPCFEFWLLMHLCDVSSSYEKEIEEIRKNHRISNRHTFLSYEVSRRANHKKRISEPIFKKEYLPNIDYAIAQSEKFETSVENIIKNGLIGSNLRDLISLLRRN